MRVVLLAVMLSFLSACAPLREPVQAAPALPRTSALGEIVGVCHRWSYPSAAEDESVQVDVYFERSPDDPMDRPREESLRAVKARGGRILHRYHLPVARFELPAGRLGELRKIVNHVRAVPDPSYHDVMAVIGFNRPVTEADVARLWGRGAEVVRWQPHYVYAVVPDAWLPELRAQPEVRYVESHGFGCITG